MGSCLCNEQKRDRADRSSCSSQSSDPDAKRPTTMESVPIEFLIMEILRFTSNFQLGSNSDERPTPLMRVTQLAETEEGWCFVVMSLVRTIPLDDPLGASTINVIFEMCPLPAWDTVLMFMQSLQLYEGASEVAFVSEEGHRFVRNLLIIIDCIAYKFAGPHCVQLLTDDLLGYLLAFLTNEQSPQLMVLALIALERLAAAAGNKERINTQLRSFTQHPLLSLALHHDSDDYEMRQVGFCARWALDNTFLHPGRQLSYESEDMTTTRVVLNMRDMTSSLKIAPDGLEARSDSHSFESVRATFKITSGVWYYEVELITAGVMQIGWATKRTSFESNEGYGVGDDAFSLGYDGCRRLVWHKAGADRVEEVSRWQPGDVLGCLVDVTRAEAVFSLNGFIMPPFPNIFVATRLYENEISSDASSEGFYPAASFMAHQQCRFNFGSRPFRYPPYDRPFQTMNEVGLLTLEERMIVPRHITLEALQREQASRMAPSRCVVCLDSQSNYGVEPCRHGSFCKQCVELLSECPLCRRGIYFFYQLPA